MPLPTTAHCNYLFTLAHLLAHLILGLLPRVALDVEVAEEHQHVHHHEGLRQREDDRRITIVHHIARVRKADGELDHLAGGDPLLPRAVDAHQRQRVVAVHDHVDEAVHSGAKVAITSSLDFADKKPRPDEQHVVVAVQEGHLVVLLAQDHPSGVQQLHELVVVVHPDEEADAE